MHKITFMLSLDKAGIPGNAARMWLDTSRNDVIEPGEELTFTTFDGKLWIANCALQGATTGVQFLVKFIAPPDTGWSFSAKDNQSVLYQAADKMTSTKELLAGRLA